MIQTASKQYKQIANNTKTNMEPNKNSICLLAFFQDIMDRHGFCITGLSDWRFTMNTMWYILQKPTSKGTLPPHKSNYPDQRLRLVHP
jgi:hypothetical protein